MRNLAWIEGNRRKVDELSGGKLAYVYVPDTSTPGYTSFNRSYFPQAGRQGAVIDERFNGGGSLADNIVDYLRRASRFSISTANGRSRTSASGPTSRSNTIRSWCAPAAIRSSRKPSKSCSRR
ncbi:MAG: hypothetical protein HY736_20130 [Verrucomicrobia bacterium]|nr:hypothetical protein [Verrucomicrobiota bacterium]